MGHEGPPAESRKYPNNPNKLSQKPTSPYRDPPTLTDVHSHARLGNASLTPPTQPKRGRQTNTPARRAQRHTTGLARMHDDLRSPRGCYWEFFCSARTDVAALRIGIVRIIRTVGGGPILTVARATSVRCGGVDCRLTFSLWLERLRAGRVHVWRCACARRADAMVEQKLLLDTLHQVRVLLQVGAGVVPTLTDTFTIHGKPRTALLNDVQVGSEIDDLPRAAKSRDRTECRTPPRGRARQACS